MQTQIGKYALRFLVFANILIIFGVFKWHADTQTTTAGALSKDVIAVPISQVVSGDPIVLEQDDERIINFIREKQYILPPSKSKYNLKKPKEDPSRGQGQFIRKLLRNMTGGFFVEAGALDGETRSNTLYLEQHLGWKGLIVEGDPSNFAILKKKNRKAWSTNTCLAIKPYPHTVEFLQHFNTGKILNSPEDKLENKKEKTVKVQCLPIFTLLSALEVSVVDYFSLDVEGFELDVLKTIPFDKVLIKTLSVEFQHTGGGKDAILEFMKDKGYSLAGEIKPPKYSWAHDIILVHKSVQH